MKRPDLSPLLSVQDFKDFYWLKEELAAFCKKAGIDHSGGKIQIALRIEEYLHTGTVPSPIKKSKPKPASNFDWSNATLSPTTVLTDNYKNTENVRAFYLREIGSHFHFTVDFMQWTRLNCGKTLAEAILEWKRLHQLKKGKDFKTDIAPQFEYNRYMRDFLADNPTRSSKDAMHYWKLKRALRGTNEYSKSDLELKEGE